MSCKIEEKSFPAVGSNLSLNPSTLDTEPGSQNFKLVQKYFT